MFHNTQESTITHSNPIRGEEEEEEEDEEGPGEEELEIDRQMAARMMAAQQQSALPPAGGEVAENLARLAGDETDFLVLSEAAGWTQEMIIRLATPLLFRTRNLCEVVIVDLVCDETVAAVSAAVCQNPTITAFGLVVTSAEASRATTEQFSLAGVQHVCHLISVSPRLRSLFINNVLHHLVEDCAELLARGLCHCSLDHLSLESNGLNENALLPLARALASQRSVKVLNLSNNRIGYEGLEIMAEVMSYNRSLVTVKLENIDVRRPLDTWEGFTLMEQCKVNKELARIGLYTRAAHMRWPRLFRRKMNRLWFVWKNLGIPIDEELWECVLAHIDPRGYINQKVCA